MALARKLASLALLLSPLAGCAGILDIQDATHDPLLDPGGGETLCEKYCAAVQRNCTAAFEQYISTEVCLDVCSHLPPGTEADDATNTAGCRLHYANSAGTVGEKDINCPAAGPGGNGICGTNCEGLCAIAFPTCERLNTFISLADCQGACTVLPDTGNYSDSIHDGFTVQCRLYHVSAAQADPNLHCPHVAGVASGPCAATAAP